MKPVLVIFSFLILVCANFQPCFAQQQTPAPADPDSTFVPPTKKELSEKKLANKNANKAALLSAILPGAGQFYNHKYWKPPILYVGIGICTYLFINNYQEYKTFNAGYNTLSNNPSLTNFQGYSITQVGVIRDQDRLYMQTDIIIIGGLYLLNIIDAYVDAHLKEFDMSENLSLRVSPLLYTANYSHLATGLSLSLRFK
jgi:hypothetical protein